MVSVAPVDELLIVICLTAENAVVTVPPRIVDSRARRSSVVAPEAASVSVPNQRPFACPEAVPLIRSVRSVASREITRLPSE